MISKPRSNGKTIRCPVCNKQSSADALFCQNCGVVFDLSEETQAAPAPEPEESTVIVPPRPRPSLAQQCPGCGELNRPGVILCESCGTNLLTGERPPITTRAIPGMSRAEQYEELLNRPVAGKETLDVGPYQKASKAGTSIFDDNMILRLQIEGEEKPLLLKLTQNHHIVIGREDGTNQVDIDMTPFYGYRQGISRRHAAIQLTGKRLDIWDLGSSNGTYLNGIRLDPNQRHQLRDGDELRLGQMVLHIFFQQKIDR